jgi:hypothetical protein
MVASIWIPGILLFALRERGGFARNTLLLGLHVTAVWLTNLPAAVIASYLLAFVAVMRAAQLKRWEPLLRAAAAMALGLTLAAFYLAPAIHEQRWVQIRQAVSPGESPKENFLFAHSGDAEHDAVLLRTSVFAVIEFVTACLFVGVGTKLRQRSSQLYNLLVSIVVLAVFLMLPLSALVWRFAPKLMFVQFPWRWLLVMNVALAVFAAVTFARNRATRLALIAVVPLIILVCYGRFQQKIYDEDRPVALAEAIASGEGYEGTDEYTPTQADNSNLQAYMPRIAIQITTEGDENQKPAPSAVVQSEFQRWDAEHKRFTVDSKLPTHDTLRLLDYPAWSVKVDGKAFSRSADESDGRMVLELPAGKHEVAIDYAHTPDRRWGMIVSLFGLCASVALFFLRSPRVEAANG